MDTYDSTIETLENELSQQKDPSAVPQGEDKLSTKAQE
jgi:hypothetical protein